MSMNLNKQIQETEAKLLAVRAEGKEALILSQSSSASVAERREHWNTVQAKKQEMEELKESLEVLNVTLEAENRARYLATVVGCEVPSDDPRAVAIFLTDGLNGVRRTLHFQDAYRQRLLERIEANKVRSQTIRDAYETPEERLEKLVAHMGELETIRDWAMGACTEALESMETNNFWNPSLRDPAQRVGKPVDNSTIFD